MFLLTACLLFLFFALLALLCLSPQEAELTKPLASWADRGELSSRCCRRLSQVRLYAAESERELHAR